MINSESKYVHIMDANNKVVAFGGRVMGEGEPKYLNSRRL